MMLRPLLSLGKPRAGLLPTVVRNLGDANRASSTSSAPSTSSPSPTSSSTSTSSNASTPTPPNPTSSNATVGSSMTAEQLQLYLSRPTWSVQSLLDPPPPPPSSSSSSQPTSHPTTSPSTTGSITPTQLHHLLRLSALPLPSSAEEEEQMLATLEAQLRFVRAVQRVDTSGVLPLVAVRDERTVGSGAGAGPREIGLQELKHVLDGEVQVGRYRRIVKRGEKRGKRLGQARVEVEERGGEGVVEAVGDERPKEIEWDPLARAPARVGRFIKVNTEKN